MRLLLAAAAVAAGTPLAVPGQPSVRPWPVGPGVRYRPVATTAAVAAGNPVAGLRCASSGTAFPLHVELFANRRVIVVPAGIGVADPATRQGAVVVAHGCTYPVSTRTPTGVVEVTSGARLTLAALFRVWGQTLGTHRLASFVSREPVRAYVDGHRVRGSVAAVPLTRHAEIVVELGAYLAPHAFFLFDGGPA